MQLSVKRTSKAIWQMGFWLNSRRWASAQPELAKGTKTRSLRPALPARKEAERRMGTLWYLPPALGFCPPRISLDALDEASRWVCSRSTTKMFGRQLSPFEVMMHCLSNLHDFDFGRERKGTISLPEGKCGARWSTSSVQDDSPPEPPLDKRKVQILLKGSRGDYVSFETPFPPIMESKIDLTSDFGRSAPCPAGANKKVEGMKGP